MLRCGQMLLAQALSVVHLGRNWQWQLNCSNLNYRRLLSMFEDRRTSLFSIHQIGNFITFLKFFIFQLSFIKIKVNLIS